MLKLLLNTYLAFLLIPLLTLAIEPTNPTGLCDRFLGDQEKTACMVKTSQTELDWYASSSCALQQDDKNFMNCLEEIKGASFSPEALELCAKSVDLTDEARLSCIKKIRNKDYTRSQIKKCSEAGVPVAVENCLSNSSRTPATAGVTKSGFQTLEIKK
ncbi:MAG TPA: hypothetical protein VIG33_01815 [Pseudobdellovibrionaceae bacterium]|jgi:hypothetical protein